MKEVNKILKRNFPLRTEFSTNLIRRNYFQIKDVDRVYAISYLNDNIVMGGTAWAIQAFINKFNNDFCLAFLFDQDSEQWYIYNKKWTIIKDIPKPYEKYAGIGSRKENLTNAGANAIRELYED